MLVKVGNGECISSHFLHGLELRGACRWEGAKGWGGLAWCPAGVKTHTARTGWIRLSHLALGGGVFSLSWASACHMDCLIWNAVTSEEYGCGPSRKLGHVQKRTRHSSFHRHVRLGAEKLRLSFTLGGKVSLHSLCPPTTSDPSHEFAVSLGQN